jgi:UDP-N-acetyl-2-amino-2-deoxyglucuronate dehydrogenase
VLPEKRIETLMVYENRRNFVLPGAAGYNAPLHLQAIRNVGGNLLDAMEPSKSVGILGLCFPKHAFFRIMVL